MSAKKRDPDGPLAIYRWLWVSLGKDSGRRAIPRFVRFPYLVSRDSILFLAWYVRHRFFRVTRGIDSTGGTMSKLRRTAAGFGWAFVLPTAFAFLLDGFLLFVLIPRGVVFPPWFEQVLSPILGTLLTLGMIWLAYLAFRGRLPGTAAAPMTPTPDSSS